MNAIPDRNDGSTRTGAHRRPAARDDSDGLSGRDRQPGRILRRQVERLADVQRRLVAARLHARVVRLQTPARRQQQRKLAVRPFDRRIVVHDAERRGRPAARRFPQPPVKERLTGMLLVGTRPLESAHLLETRVAHAAGEMGSDGAELVPDLLRRRFAPVVTQPPGDLRDDPQLVARARRRIDRLAHALDAPFAVGDGPLALAPRRGGRQDDVRELRRAREEDLLHDEMVEAAQPVLDVVRVGVGLRGILADDVERRQVAPVHRAQHLGEVHAAPRRDDRVPPLAHPRARVVILLDVLEARQLVGDRAHVAAALHVVLAAKRIAARSPAADVPGQQRQIDQREDVVDGVVVLRDPERPADHRRAGARVRVRGVADDVGRDTGRLRTELQRVRFDRGPVGVESRGGAGDERFVDEAGMDDLARHRVGERDVTADVQAQPHVGPLGRRSPSRVDHVEPGPAPDSLQQMMEPDGVRGARVRSPEEHDVRVLDLAVGARASTRAEYRRQTDDARRVSCPVATVDVVGAERDTGELLREEVHLVGGLRAAEDAERVGPAGIDVAAEPVRSGVERVLPRGRTQDAADADQGFGQARIRPRRTVDRHTLSLLPGEARRKKVTATFFRR
jgi:hypothetical protein